MRKNTERFAAGLDLKSADSATSKARQVVRLETVLAKRDKSEILRDMRTRSVKNFGKR